MAARPTPSRSATTSTFHNGDKLTAEDVAVSLNKIAFPPDGVVSPRSATFMMVDKIVATDPHTVVIRLKFATSAFLPALADPYNWIYQKKILDKDPHWYEKNIMGSGPFVFEEFQTGQLIKGKRNPHYYHQGLPYLDGFVGIYAPKQAVQLDAIRAGRAATEFRGYPPSAIDQLKQELGDKIVVQPRKRTTSTRFGGIGSCRCALPSMAGRSARATTPTRIWRRFGSAPPNAGRVAHTRRWRRLKSRPANNLGTRRRWRSAEALTTPLRTD
jgi:Bacterial extracellular solute-binding proteins, family 5 Middle